MSRTAAAVLAAQARLADARPRTAEFVAAWTALNVANSAHYDSLADVRARTDSLFDPTAL